jgi:L-lysine exporter family protein LysE/ArgO
VSLAAAASGFGLGLALITPIGAQNALVLRTAVRAQRIAILVVVGFVIFVDVALIGVGALGAGAILDGRDWLRFLLYLGGIALLVPLGIGALRAASAGGSDAYDDVFEDDGSDPLTAKAGGDPSPWMRTYLVPIVAASLLNPHVYLDTVAILGSAIATTDPENRLSFTLGAMIASAVWFIGLAALGALVLRRFGAPVARAVDAISGVIMLLVAIVFAYEAIHLLV